MSASRRGLERDGYAYIPPREDGLSGQDAWDDSALMEAYNSAVERYKITHGLGAGSASGAARATLSPSVGGSRNATPASPARGGVAGAPRDRPRPPPRRRGRAGRPSPEPRDVRARSPVRPGGEAASWDAYYAHYAAHARTPSQGEYYDPYYGYHAAPPPSHDYPGRHPPPHPRQRPPGGPAFPGGFHHPPLRRRLGIRRPARPSRSPRPRGAYDAHGHHYGSHAGPPRSLRWEATSGGGRARRRRLRWIGAAGDYEGAHPDADVDELANLLMAWYYAGYYTGQYSKRGGGEDEGGEEGGY